MGYRGNVAERARARELRADASTLVDIEVRRRDGLERVGMPSDCEFLTAGVGLYAGDGTKTGGEVAFANSNPDLIAFFCCVVPSRLHRRRMPPPRSSVSPR